jgi:hypothetical protein
VEKGCKSDTRHKQEPGATYEAVFAGELTELRRERTCTSSQHSSTECSSVGVCRLDITGDIYDPLAFSHTPRPTTKRPSWRRIGTRQKNQVNAPELKGAACPEPKVLPMWMLRGTRVDNSHCSGAFVAFCGGVYAGQEPLLHSSSSAPLLAAASRIEDCGGSPPCMHAPEPLQEVATWGNLAVATGGQVSGESGTEEEVWSEEHCVRLACALAAQVDTFSGFCGRIAEGQLLKVTWPKGVTCGHK